MPAATTTRRARRPQAPALRFDQRLVLNQWILGLFEEDSFIPLTEADVQSRLRGPACPLSNRGQGDLYRRNAAEGNTRLKNHPTHRTHYEPD